MNNLPLQPLVWFDGGDCYGDLEAHSPSHYYVITEEDEKQKVMYGKHYHISKEATGFATIDEAKAWAWSHYNEKMQPYVKTMPTWISVKDSLPTHHQEVIVYRHDGKEASIEYSLYFNAPYFNDDGMIGFGNVKNGGDFLTDVYYWQPIETKALYEAMAMQLQIKGG